MHESIRDGFLEAEALYKHHIQYVFSSPDEIVCRVDSCNQAELIRHIDDCEKRFLALKSQAIDFAEGYDEIDAYIEALKSHKANLYLLIHTCRQQIRDS